MMNKKILAAAIAATCAIGAVGIEAGAAEKAKSQTLGELSCLANQVAGFDGELWACIDKPLDGEIGPQGPQGDIGPQGPQGESGAPGYEFVDGSGNILGDVVFIEDRFHVFGYFNYLSTSSIIEVVATTSKQGEPINAYNFLGQFIRKNVLYTDNLCETTGHTNGATREIGMLDYLQSDSFIYWANMDRTTWTELVLSDVPAPSGAQDWFIKLDSDSDCISYGNADISSWAVQIESYGEGLNAPVPPILVVAKP